MTSIRIEQMSDAFAKFHLEGPWPFGAVLHRFAEPDRGDPHDHPWPFTSFVLWGGYVERMFDPADGSSEWVARRPGDSFTVPATRIHRIEYLPEGECWTLILPGPHERTSGFWQFRDGGSWFREWHCPEFRRIDAERRAA